VIGTWQVLVIIYVLFIALGPRRVVRWIRWTGDTSARLRGKRVTTRKSSGWLRAIELFEYSSQLGWAFLVIGATMAIYAGTIDDRHVASPGHHLRAFHRPRPTPGCPMDPLDRRYQRAPPRETSDNAQELGLAEGDRAVRVLEPARVGVPGDRRDDGDLRRDDR